MNRHRWWVLSAMALMGLAGCKHLDNWEPCPPEARASAYPGCAPCYRGGLLPSHPLSPQATVCETPCDRPYWPGRRPQTRNSTPPPPLVPNTPQAQEPGPTVNVPPAPPQEGEGGSAPPAGSDPSIRLAVPETPGTDKPRDNARLLPPDSSPSPPAAPPSRSSTAEPPLAPPAAPTPPADPAPSDTSPPSKAAVTEEATTPKLPVGIPQFGMAKERVASGLRPILDGLDWLSANGYRTVLHLRAPGQDDSTDRKQFEARGLRYLSLEVSPDQLTREVVEQFNRTVGEAGNLPLFVYDRDGTLAGGMWYLHFRLVEGASDQDARTRAARLGLKEEQEGEGRRMWLAVQKYLATVGR